MRAASGAPVVLAGDGEGMVDAAAVGLLDRPGLVLYSAALSPAELQQALADGADLVVTDTNRLRGLRWGGLRDNHGPTVAPGEAPLREDPYAQDLSPFDDRSDDTRTIAEPRRRGQGRGDLVGSAALVHARRIARPTPSTATPAPTGGSWGSTPSPASGSGSR